MLPIEGIKSELLSFNVSYTGGAAFARNFSNIASPFSLTLKHYLAANSADLVV